MGQLSKVVGVIVGLTFLLAIQPALGSSHLHQHKKRHGRLSGHAAFVHARLTNRAAFAAGIRAARKLSLLSSDPSQKTRTTSEESKTDAHYSMGGSIKGLDALRKEEKLEQRIVRPDAAANRPQVFMSSVIGHGELKASKHSASIVVHEELLSKKASDSDTSRELERAESNTKDRGTHIAAPAAKAGGTTSLHARNVAIIDRDQENAMETAESPMLVKSRKDEVAHVSLGIHQKKEEKQLKSPQAN